MENYKEFIKLKNYFLLFKNVIVDSEEFLYLDDINHKDYLHNCSKLLSSFHKLENYLENDFMCKFLDDEKSTSIFFKFKHFRSQISSWQEIKEKHKQKLFGFIFKVAEGHKCDMFRFY